MNGSKEIEKTLSGIFSQHKTPPFITKVREIKKLDKNVILLRAVVGMIPEGKKEIEPSLNAIQSMITVKENETWKITLFQNTPAKFDMNPGQRDELTEELTQKNKII